MDQSCRPSLSLCKSLPQTYNFLFQVNPMRARQAIIISNVIGILEVQLRRDILQEREI